MGCNIWDNIFPFFFYFSRPKGKHYLARKRPHFSNYRFRPLLSFIPWICMIVCLKPFQLLDASEEVRGSCMALYGCSGPDNAGRPLGCGRAASGPPGSWWGCGRAASAWPRRRAVGRLPPGSAPGPWTPIQRRLWREKFPLGPLHKQKVCTMGLESLR